MIRPIPVASVHGRFQPPHLEHLEYILAALDKAQYLYIGVTQFERAHLADIPGGGGHRGDISGNPLTYFERTELLTRALHGEGISPGRYRIVPFPIERPTELGDFLPRDIPVLTTRVDEWNDRKIDLLQGLGYRVEVLYERDPKGVAGSEIRKLISQSDDRWTSMVPPATVDYLKSLDLPARLGGGEFPS